MTSDVRCNHSGCGCVVPTRRLAQGQRTCSDFCEAQEGDTVRAATRGGECGCGHTGCRVADATHP